MASTRPVTLDLDDDTLRYLAVLGRPAEVLALLASAAADGVRRPGAWERGWITQVCGSDWAASLRPDPAAPYSMLPPELDDKPRTP
jgi:hypothetical protein